MKLTNLTMYLHQLDHFMWFYNAVVWLYVLTAMYAKNSMKYKRKSSTVFNNYVIENVLVVLFWNYYRCSK